MGSFSFWVGSLFFPLLLLAVNSIARWSFRMPQSAAGDLILLFGAFDAAVILQADDFKKFSYVFPDANDLRALYLLFFVINAVLWVVAVFKIERAIHHSFDHQAGKYTKSPTLAMIGYLTLSVIAILYNTAPFTIRSSLW